MLNRLTSTGEDDLAFIPDEDDTKTIPPPLARLAARRINLPVDDEHVSDAEDLVAAGIAVGAWLLRGIVDAVKARRARTRIPDGVVGVHQADADQNGARV